MSGENPHGEGVRSRHQIGVSAGAILQGDHLGLGCGSVSKIPCVGGDGSETDAGGEQVLLTSDNGPYMIELQAAVDLEHITGIDLIHGAEGPRALYVFSTAVVLCRAVTVSVPRHLAPTQTHP